LLSPNAAGAQSSRALEAVANAFGGTGLTSIEIQGA
jgi:hypothetical protein